MVHCWFGTDSGEFRIKRYRTHPEPHLENLENGRKEFLRIKDEMADSDRPVFGGDNLHHQRCALGVSSTTAR